MKKITWMIMAGLLLLLAACGNEGEAEGTSEEKEEKEKVTIDHKLGETTVEKNPEKVVVFDFGTLDTLDELGVEVAGVPKDSLPSYLSDYNGDDYAHVGGLKEPDFEEIYEVAPDLIIISGRQMDLYEEFAEIAPTIYVELDAENYMESFEGNVKMLAEIFDKEEEAQEKLSTIENHVESLKEKTAEAEGLIVLSNGGKVSAYGEGSRFGILHDTFGVQAVDKTIDVATHGQNVSFEYILEQNPEYLFVIDRDAVVNDEPAAKQTIENDLVKQTTAYEEGQIVYLDPNYWYLSGGGLQSVQGMVDEIESSMK
ncbi:siderophore ABC transporter substrate-binding protein [Halobacillus karajensis]|uniref:ABC transporter solute-binding protein YclQ n=1 Tax=Halobacillus karajensis TaxID=195088 RepID=A0A024P7S1_9BACI|nr:siderophore ABC transporter substrate-binding protein [Halobacillus karajensis]CDQ20936.1 putative ABC transporter solute-binding protein YclQ precursor [Halobacillus karajensis]CDQ25000.1 putative ABC transporter solute-binding protein YclQ precursor [Halobacillus karajensis]CDQ28639.1 putative ABC transporter solute-binding protein YclQ precursor [Halobacillus karajensis]